MGNPDLPISERGGTPSRAVGSDEGGAEMTHPISSTDWQKALWKIIRNPTLEVVAAIVVVLLATWLLVQGEAENRQQPLFPVPAVVR